MPNNSYLIYLFPPFKHQLTMAYSVSIQGPQPAWIVWDYNVNLPKITFTRPNPLSYTEARELKKRADICCGGTLKIVRF